MISIGLLTPHATPGPEAELPDMAPGQVVTRVSRILAPGASVASPGAPPTSPSALRALTAPSALDQAVEGLAGGSVDVIGYASTSTGYAMGPDAEATMVSRLSRRCGLPVVSSSLSTGAAFLALTVQPSRIRPDAVIEWISRSVGDDAEAVFIGGTGFRAARAIQALEERLGRPVLESNQVLLWSALAAVPADVGVVGYGRLFVR